MTPETGDFMDKARPALREATAVIAINLPEAAGRAAYLPSFHAAQALIFHRTSAIAKTHSGVRSEFARRTKDDPNIDRGCSTFLAQAYALKTIADYEMGPRAVVLRERAAAAIETATALVERISKAISD